MMPATPTHRITWRVIPVLVVGPDIFPCSTSTWGYASPARPHRSWSPPAWSHLTCRPTSFPRGAQLLSFRWRHVGSCRDPLRASATVQEEARGT